jgi:hypothetical protein
MAQMKEITCLCGCKRKKMVRTADVKRGWGKFFSKRCKAIHQERRTGQYRNYLAGHGENDFSIHDEGDQSWDAHKDTF